MTLQGSGSLSSNRLRNRLYDGDNNTVYTLQLFVIPAIPNDSGQAGMTDRRNNDNYMFLSFPQAKRVGNPSQRPIPRTLSGNDGITTVRLYTQTLCKGQFPESDIFRISHRNRSRHFTDGTLNRTVAGPEAGDLNVQMACYLKELR